MVQNLEKRVDANSISLKWLDANTKLNATEAALLLADNLSKAKEHLKSMETSKTTVDRVLGAVKELVDLDNQLRDEYESWYGSELVWYFSSLTSHSEEIWVKMSRLEARIDDVSDGLTKEKSLDMKGIEALKNQFLEYATAAEEIEGKLADIKRRIIDKKQLQDTNDRLDEQERRNNEQQKQIDENDAKDKERDSREKEREEQEKREKEEQERKAAEAEEEKLNEVRKLIEDLPEKDKIKKRDEKQVEEARKAFDDLTEEQKQVLRDERLEEKLKDAEKRIDEINDRLKKHPTKKGPSL